MDTKVKQAYKELINNLKFVLTDKGCKKIAICSAETSEGKSITSINLARSLVEENNKVLIIDCDMREGVIHSLFNEKEDKGLSNILCNEIENISSVIKKTNIPNISIIQKGTTPPVPKKLLSSQVMTKLLDDCEIAFDYVILDTPPINLVTDALALKNNIDGTLLVVRENYSKTTSLNKAIEQLKSAEMNILGFVINDSKSINK